MINNDNSQSYKGSVAFGALEGQPCNKGSSNTDSSHCSHDGDEFIVHVGFKEFNLGQGSIVEHTDLDHWNGLCVFDRRQTKVRLVWL